jgi:hypothetical protein
MCVRDVSSDAWRGSDRRRGNLVFYRRPVNIVIGRGGNRFVIGVIEIE